MYGCGNVYNVRHVDVDMGTDNAGRVYVLMPSLRFKGCHQMHPRCPTSTSMFMMRYVTCESCVALVAHRGCVPLVACFHADEYCLRLDFDGMDV